MWENNVYHLTEKGSMLEFLRAGWLTPLPRKVSGERSLSDSVRATTTATTL